MPSEKILGELENFGVEVETMGCVPPYADEKTYLFQCKACKHEWFDYNDAEENYFEFTLNTYPGQYMGKIVYEEGFVSLVHNQYSEYLCIPNDEDILDSVYDSVRIESRSIDCYFSLLVCV